MNESGGNFLKGLLGGDSGLRSIYEAHRSYEKRVAKLNKRIYLTAEEKAEEKRLKKMKLMQKDRMEGIVKGR